MELLIAFVTEFVGKLAEYTFEPVIRQVGYVICYNRNLKRLEKKVGDLGDARQRVQHAVETEERKGRKIEDDVQTWLTAVDKVTEEATNFLKDENNACFCHNPRRHHWRSRKSTKMALDVAGLLGQTDFPNIAYDVKPEEVFNTSITDYHPTDSRTSIVKKIMNELTHANTDMIGVYGIGGVGKTTLAKEVYRQSLRDKTLFDDVVVILDVKQIPELEKLQKIIAEKLGMEILGDESMDKRALRICERIKNKKVLVILDDIREKVDLEKVGLPRGLTCKVLLTSRTREVLSVEMGTQKEFPLDTLEVEETWCLFEKMAGGAVQNPVIREVATQVARECGGLPVVIVTVASALKNKTALHDWKDALRRLKTFERKGFKEKAYLALEWSYEQLDEEELRPLFLLCGVIRENTINLLDLLKYSMGLGLIKNINTMEEARNALYSLVGKLQDSCLLLENTTDGHEYLRMHDLVHEVAIRIASRDQHVFQVVTGGEFKGWPNEDFSEKSTMIIVKNCNIPSLPEGMQCPELILFLYASSEKDQSLEIPNNYFEGMKKLRVLDLTLLSFPSLPTSLQFLKCLKTLCLDRCTLGDIALVGELRNLEILSLWKSKFKKLPKELGQLTRLRLLDLTGCSQLQVIPHNVISRLKKLEELMMGYNSFNQWEAEGVNSTQRRNANLEELKHLPHLTTLHIHIPDADILPANLFSSELRRFQICLGSAWKWEDLDRSLNTLKLKLTTSNKLDQGLKMLVERTENLYLEGLEGANNSILYQLLDTEGLQQLIRLHVHNNIELSHTVGGKVYFPNLTWLAVSELNSSKFLLSSSMARSLAQLKHLQITRCQIMEEIVSMNEETDGNMFCQLQHLELQHLPNLTKFCSRYTDRANSPFERLQLEDASKQDKFVLDPMGLSSTMSKKIKQSDSKEIVESYFIFDENIGLPSLKSLSISGAVKLTKVWHNQLAADSFCKLAAVEIHECESLINIFGHSMMGRLNALESLEITKCPSVQVVFDPYGGIGSRDISAGQINLFECQNLQSITIDSCESLKTIIPTSVARNLQRLKTLRVINCGVENIVANEEGRLRELPTFVFPKVTSATFSELPKLKCFYSGMHVSSWPSLVDLGVYGCDKVDIFAEEISSLDGNHETNCSYSPTKQTLLLIEKDSSFPNLVWLRIDGMEIWNGPLPVKLFSKLKDLYVTDDPKSKSVVFFDKLQVDIEAASSSCAVGVGTHGQLPHLKHLGLIGMHELMHLGQDDSQPARPNFPYLEILHVNSCHSLRNLRSSAISFENLTTLHVSYCIGLKYLLTHSQAKSLTQLIKLKVETCLRLEGIVGSINEDDDDSRDDITFKRLKFLKLRKLPRLQGFCLGNRSVKLPSLETLSISNRLKLKIFSHEEMLQTTTEEQDTDVEYWETWLAEHDATGKLIKHTCKRIL